MAAALSAPCAVAALVLAVAGAGKLRAPATAAGALGWPAALVRAFAAGELALAAWALGWAAAPAEAAMALVYAAFAGVGAALRRRGRACGCFGAGGGAVSPVQVGLSGALALVSAVGGAAGAHALGWLLERPPVVVPGLLAAACATILAYTQLPELWHAWSGR